ncbi:hypothetical protein YC2023_095635 [Brassica napus]
MRFVPSEGKKDSKRRRSWWERFFFDDNDDGNWLGLREEDIVDEMSNEEKLETWKKRRAEFDCLVCAFAYKYVKTVPLASCSQDAWSGLANLRIFLMMIYGCVVKRFFNSLELAEEEVREPESICQHMV